MAGLVEIRVPDLGDYKDVEVIDVPVKAGDVIAEEASLITLETEKATMDVPSPAGGTIKELKIKRGDRVSKGDLIALARVGAAGGAGRGGDGCCARIARVGARAAGPAQRSHGDARARRGPGARAARCREGATSRRTSAQRVRSRVIDEPGFSRAHASPSVRRFARELGVDLARITGTGNKGRITADDVKAHVKQLLTAPARTAEAALPDVPRVDFAAFGPIERRP